MEKKLTVAAELYEQMSTVSIEQARDKEEALALTKAAKDIGTWDVAWKPYCVVSGCSSMARMRRESYGFKCGACGNMIGHNLCRLKESPRNFR